ncbi:hypothetical protein EDC01DRAFT_752694 [Geopyxis carbonaria]|nr:hypothetical protein EDC01DRAFT_752694 [Geopyxis carbonaria]
MNLLSHTAPNIFPYTEPGFLSAVITLFILYLFTVAVVLLHKAIQHGFGTPPLRPLDPLDVQRFDTNPSATWNRQRTPDRRSAGVDPMTPLPDVRSVGVDPMTPPGDPMDLDTPSPITPFTQQTTPEQAHSQQSPPQRTPSPLLEVITLAMRGLFLGDRHSVLTIDAPKRQRRRRM